MGLSGATKRLDDRIVGKPGSAREWRITARMTIPLLLLMALAGVWAVVETIYALAPLAVWTSFCLGYQRRRAEESLGLRPWFVRSRSQR